MSMNDCREMQVLKFNSKTELCLKIIGGISFCGFYTNKHQKKKKKTQVVPPLKLYFLLILYLFNKKLILMVQIHNYK